MKTTKISDFLDSKLNNINNSLMNYNNTLMSIHSLIVIDRNFPGNPAKITLKLRKYFKNEKYQVEGCIEINSNHHNICDKLCKVIKQYCAIQKIKNNYNIQLS